MIVQEIPLSNLYPNQEKNDLILDGQRTSIEVNTLKDISRRTYNTNELGISTLVSIYFNGNDVALSTKALYCNDLNEYAMPKTNPIFKGHLFFYSPFVKTNPVYTQFGTVYRLIYSDTFDFTNTEFLSKLNALFGR